MSITKIDEQIAELKRRREDYLKELPTRELRREQLFGKVLMDQVRDGNAPANSWISSVAQGSGDEAWLFEDDYLRDDGYKKQKTNDGKIVWAKTS